MGSGPALQRPSSGSTNATYAERGTAAADTLFGTPGAEGLCGLGGNDLVDGRAGDDYLSGGAGNDSLAGGGGADFLDAGAGNDSLGGGLGADFLDGGAGNDTLFGGAGVDVHVGGAGDDALFAADPGDALFGGADDDVAYGAAGAQLLDGGEGNDSLFGLSGADVFDGGPGDDVLVDVAWSSDADVYRYEAGDGSDVIEDAAGANVLKLYEVPSSMVSAFPRPNNDYAVLISGSGLVLLKGGALNPITIEHCQTEVDVAGNSVDLELCGDDLTQPGATATLRMRNGPPNATALLVAGTNLSPVPIAGTDSFLAPGGSIVVLSFPTNGSLDVTTPPSAAGTGLTVYAQMIVGNGVDLETSNALEIDT